MDAPVDALFRFDPAGGRIDSASPLLHDGTLEVAVLHVGTRVAILRPTDDDGDDVVITDLSVGLMPGGLALPESEFRRWRDLLLDRRELIATRPAAFASTHRADLRIEGSVSAEEALVAAIDHLPRASHASQFTVTIDDGRRAAAAALSFDVGAVDIVAANLVGLGMGSTPAGDDLLVGVCAGLRAGGADDAATALARAATSVVERTTRSSRLFLRAAVHGRFSERVHWLAHSMHSAGEAVRAVRDVRSWGATSGRDLAAGFLGAQAHLIGVPLSSMHRGAA